MADASGVAGPVTTEPPTFPADVHPDAVSTTTQRLRRVGTWAVLVLVAAIVVAPLWVFISGAIQPGRLVLDYPRSLIPRELTLSVFVDAWTEARLARYLVNSAIVAVAITSLQVLTSIGAAYAFAFLRFPFRRTLFVLFLGTFMIPAEVTIVANVATVRSLGWIDSYQGLVIPFGAAAFGTFLLRQAFLALPRDLADAAEMDGLGHLRFLFDVVVPLSRPAIGALALFSFLGAWNQYLWPLLVTTDPDLRTVQIGLRALLGSTVDRPNLTMAGTLLATLPIAVLLAIFQGQLVRGLTAGAVKG